MLLNILAVTHARLEYVLYDFAEFSGYKMIALDVVSLGLHAKYFCWTSRINQVLSAAAETFLHGTFQK